MSEERCRLWLVPASSYTYTLSPELHGPCAGVAALALAGVIVKGVVWPVAPCVGIESRTSWITMQS